MKSIGNYPGFYIKLGHPKPKSTAKDMTRVGVTTSSQGTVEYEPVHC